MTKLLFKPPDNSTGEYRLTVVKSLTFSLFNISIYISMVATICFLHNTQVLCAYVLLTGN